jgi:hypothetical protein
MKRRLLAGLLLAAGVMSAADTVERNAWPFRVDLFDESTGQLLREDVAGPFYSWKLNPGAGTTEAWRPLLLKQRNGPASSTYLLYPLFTWRRDGSYTHFSFFDLVNDDQVPPEAGRPGVHGFDVWPFYFSRETGNSATSYHALFPIAGTIKQRFGKDRLTWCLFPLYFNTDKAGMEITSAPWPFIRVINGAGHHGFEFWPLFGSRGRADDYHRQFYLWPLFYKDETNLSAPVPQVSLGALPFYARESGPGFLSESYAWPFVGYTHRTEPVKYDEKRYFWPFLMQGRGDGHYVNRWGPFYTHSVIKGYDKTWVLWPLFRHARWDEDGVAQEKNQFFFVLYSSLEQRSLTNPAAAPAYKQHIWPFYSAWDNGAGRRQFQLLSPFEVFFPNNEIVRDLYTPLFALFRFDQRAPGETHGSILWNLVSWRHSPARREFRLGPLGWRRDTGAPHANFFLFDFHPEKDTKSKEAAPP